MPTDAAAAASDELVLTDGAAAACDVLVRTASFVSPSAASLVAADGLGLGVREVPREARAARADEDGHEARAVARLEQHARALREPLGAVGSACAPECAACTPAPTGGTATSFDTPQIVWSARTYARFAPGSPSPRSASARSASLVHAVAVTVPRNASPSAMSRRSGGTCASAGAGSAATSTASRTRARAAQATRTLDFKRPLAVCLCGSI